MKEKDKNDMSINDLADRFDILAKQMEAGFAETRGLIQLSSEGSKIYTDEFAAMVARGFSDMQNQMDKRFDVVDERFDAVDKRFESVEGSIQSFRNEFSDFRSEVRSEFKKLWAEIDNINDRLDRIEKNKAEELELISGDILLLKTKVARLEQKVNKFKLAN